MTLLFGRRGMKSPLTGAGNFPISVCFPFNRKERKSILNP